MHILYATQGYKPARRVGGPILSVSAAAEELVRRGHRVSVVTTSADVDEDMDVPLNQPVNVEGVEVRYFRPDRTLQRTLPFVPYLSQSSGFLYSPLMRAAIQKLMPGIDIVHTHAPFVYPVLAAGKAAIQHRKPLVLQARGAYNPEALRRRKLKKWMYMRLFERQLLRSATATIALTQAEVSSYRMLGVKARCEVVPNGINTSQYGPFSPLPELPIPSDRLPILFLGRLHTTKGVHHLLEAFELVHQRIPRAVLVLAGPDELGLEKEFRAAAAHANIQDKVFFPGLVSGAIKRALLSRSVLFCLPSINEGLSMAVLEALASGVPVLLSPGCFFPEVEVAGAGKIVSPAPALLGQALVELLSDPAKLAHMGEIGLRFVAENHNWSKIVDQLVSVYEDAIVATRKTPPIG